MEWRENNEQPVIEARFERGTFRIRSFNHSTAMSDAKASPQIMKLLTAEFSQPSWCPVHLAQRLRAQCPGGERVVDTVLQLGWLLACSKPASRTPTNRLSMLKSLCSLVLPCSTPSFVSPILGSSLHTSPATLPNTSQTHSSQEIQVSFGYYALMMETSRFSLTSLSFILLMWRIGWAPNSIPIYIQQDATLHSLRVFISGNCSACFGWYFSPSSGAHTTVSTESGICHTVTICRYRGRVGTDLSVLWVAYATHSTLKPLGVVVMV
jgi:hypothetical protein